jgi:hypothetical protein
MEENKELTFSDLDIHIHRDNFFDCKKISIDGLVNKKITILWYQSAEKEFDGKKRTPIIIHCMCDGIEYKCFTNSKQIKEQMMAVAEKYKDQPLPHFSATIIKEQSRYYRLA